MKKTAVILILIVFVTVCASRVNVSFILRNNSSISITVPKKAFKLIEDQVDLFHPSENSNISVSDETIAENCTLYAQGFFKNKLEYTQFRQLWDIDYSKDSTKYNPVLIDQTFLTADLFEKCLLTANYLGIQGEYAERFAENMVKYGLLSTYSAEIMALEVFSVWDLSYDTFWDLLYAFLRQIGFEHKVTYSSTGKIMLRIEKTSACPKKIDEEYAGPSQTARMRTVVYSSLGPALSPEKERKEAVLGWLLLNIGGSSVDIQYTIDIASESTSMVKKTIQNFTKENEKGACIYVNGLSFEIDYEQKSFSRLLVLQYVPSLLRFELHIISSCIISNVELCSFVDKITLCKSLKILKIITQQILESVIISRLVKTLPIIEELCFSCKPLEDTAIENLKKCTHLTTLDIYGTCQPNAIIQELVSHLLSLKRLTIHCNSLDSISGKSFEKWKHLESLILYGHCQSSSVVQALVRNLPSLENLIVTCQALDPTVAESFETCKHLENLEIWGWSQTSNVVQALVRNLPSLKELTIVCDYLEPEDAESFETCTQLENLNIFGEQSIYFLINLLEVLPSLKDLRIDLDTADHALADALRKCFNLCFLILKVDNYTPGFLEHYLKDPLPKLKYLKLYNFVKNKNYSEKDNRAVKEASAKGMTIYLD